MTAQDGPDAGHIVRRSILLLAAAALIPYGFTQLDHAYVDPVRLKRSVSVFGVETEQSDLTWRVRFGVASLSGDPQTVKATAIWRNDDLNEVGRSVQQITVLPGDTAFVGMTTRRLQPAGGRVHCSVDYEVITADRR